MRLVIDTNLWISYLLKPDSPVVPRLDELLSRHTLLYSHDTLMELGDVLIRPKFARYLDQDDARAFITELIATGEKVGINTPIQACRDPKDDKFLELALSGAADAILTGDRDLLELHPFQGVAIQCLRDFSH